MQEIAGNVACPRNSEEAFVAGTGWRVKDRWQMREAGDSGKISVPSACHEKPPEGVRQGSDTIFGRTPSLLCRELIGGHVPSKAAS